MNDEMQHAAIGYANLALDKFDDEKEISSFMNEAFDAMYGGTWYCRVGRTFGGSVPDKPASFIYFYIGTVAVLLFRDMEKKKFRRSER